MMSCYWSGIFGHTVQTSPVLAPTPRINYFKTEISFLASPAFRPGRPWLCPAGQDPVVERVKRGSRKLDGGSHKSPPPHREADPHRSRLSQPGFPVPPPSLIPKISVEVVEIRPWRRTQKVEGSWEPSVFTAPRGSKLGQCRSPASPATKRAVRSR